MTTPPLRVIKQLGVVGAGQMGSSIALLAAMHEMQVCVTDVSTMALGKGTDAMASSLKRLIKSGKAPPDSLDATLARIRTSTTMQVCLCRHDFVHIPPPCTQPLPQDLDAVDLVIEAASEREDMKHGIFAALDQVTPSHAILASNTSSLSITRLAAATHRPDKVVGIHFMNPPVLMGLVELVRGLATSQETFDAAAHFAHAMGKTTCVSQDRPGFIVNRILMPMINEAFYALMEVCVGWWFVCRVVWVV